MIAKFLETIVQENIDQIEYKVSTTKLLKQFNTFSSEENFNQFACAQKKFNIDMENIYGARKQKISTNFYFLNIPHIRGILEKKYKMVFDTHMGTQPKEEEGEPSVDDYMRM